MSIISFKRYLLKYQRKSTKSQKIEKENFLFYSFKNNSSLRLSHTHIHLYHFNYTDGETKRYNFQ